MSFRILIVDDHADILEGLKERLEWIGYETLTAKDGAEALSLIQDESPSMVLLDLELPVLNGIEILRRLNGAQSHPDSRVNGRPRVQELTPPIVIMTAFGSINRAVEAMKLGACDFLTKPFEPEHVVLLVEKILEREHLKKEVKLLRSEVGWRYAKIVAKSRAMKEVLDAAKPAALSDVAILLQGETGTGKELLARSIHRWSSRAEKSFWRSIAPRFRKPCSRTSCLAMNGGHSPGS